MYALSKLNRQNEQTWVNLQKRLNEVQFSYEKLFPNPDVHDYIKNKAVSVGSCEGYLIPSLLTTTAFLLASKGSHVQTLTHSQPLNIFTIFVGYPGTGNYIVSSIEYNSDLFYSGLLSSKFLYTVQLLIASFSINPHRKIFCDPACRTKPVGKLGLHFCNYQQNNVFWVGETDGNSTQRIHSLP